VSPLARILLGAVYAYRVTLSPLMGGHCRFHPTCSAYALEAIRLHGAIRGGGLTLRRLLRCHPFARSSGYDPVPVRHGGEQSGNLAGSMHTGDGAGRK
jgi:putative membrane protein insertion efficiency factor